MPLLRRRRPLLRAAAVGGGAYVAGRHHAERQQEVYDEGQQSGMAYASAPAAPAAPTPPVSRGPSSDDIARLQQLGQLHDQGVLTDEEFAQEKQKIIGRV
jgi:hypothetical protein